MKKCILLLILVFGFIGTNPANAAICTENQTELFKEIEYSWNAMKDGIGSDEDNFDDELGGEILEFPELIQAIKELSKSSKDKSFKGHLSRFAKQISQREKARIMWAKDVQEDYDYCESMGMVTCPNGDLMAQYEQKDINEYDQGIEKRLVILKRLVTSNRC